ncbi:hypothetical protein QQ054_20330 [Oscillatoria amoena NRMC-F 0135]|nr:hypothetical protein [Oscillatoria amoena NRMC-F 0135]
MDEALRSGIGNGCEGTRSQKLLQQGRSPIPIVHYPYGNEIRNFDRFPGTLALRKMNGEGLFRPSFKLAELTEIHEDR